MYGHYPGLWLVYRLVPIGFYQGSAMVQSGYKALSPIIPYSSNLHPKPHPKPIEGSVDVHEDLMEFKSCVSNSLRASEAPVLSGCMGLGFRV